jgi:glutathione S-transferase
VQEWLNYVATELHKSFSPLFNSEASEDWKRGTTGVLTARLDWLDAEMRERSYLVAGRFSVADAYLFTVLGWTQYVAIDLGRWPALVRFAQRVGGRPKVLEALRAEGLSN